MYSSILPDMELLTVNETAKLLRVSPITVRRRIADGQLEAVRVGKGIRVRREAVDEFLRPALREYSDEEIERFLEEDRLTPAQADRVAGYVARVDREKPKLESPRGYFMSDLYELGPDGKLTPESQKNAARVIEETRRERKLELEKRGGVPWPNSWELINEGRDERTRRLMGDE